MVVVGGGVCTSWFGGKKSKQRNRTGVGNSLGEGSDGW